MISRRFTTALVIAGALIWFGLTLAYYIHIQADTSAYRLDVSEGAQQ